MRRLPGFLPVPVNCVHCVRGCQDGDTAEQGSASRGLCQCQPGTLSVPPAPSPGSAPRPQGLAVGTKLYFCFFCFFHISPWGSGVRAEQQEVTSVHGGRELPQLSPRELWCDLSGCDTGDSLAVTLGTGSVLCHPLSPVCPCWLCCLGHRAVVPGASSPLVTDCCGWAGLQLGNKASIPAGWGVGTALGWAQADEAPSVPRALVWV